MPTFQNIKPLFKNNKSRDTGLIWTKMQTLSSGAAEFDKFLYEVNNSLWTPDDIFGQIMIVDSVAQIYNVSIQLKDNGETVTVTLPAWTPILIQGVKIISSGSTATAVTVWGGQ